MDNIKSDHIYALPSKYKEFIAKKEKGLDLFFSFLKKIITFDRFFPLREQPAFIIENLIVGSNAFLTLLLLYKISEERKNTTVGIYLPKELDYWSYDLIGSEDLIIEIKKSIFFKECNKIEDVLEILINKIKNNKTNLLILDNRFRISYVEYDKNTKASFFWFDNKKNNIAKNERFIEENNEIKDFINKKIIALFKKELSCQKLQWDFKIKFNRLKNKEEEKKALAISKNTFITSLPQGWMTLNNVVEKDKVCFKAEESYCLYGTSKMIYFEKNNMNKNCLKEVLEILNSSEMKS